jgi:hypothetical protein
LELFSKLGALRCPNCVQRHAKKKALAAAAAAAAAAAVAADGGGGDRASGAVVAASLAADSPKVFLSPSSLLAHMASCCPSDVPAAGPDALEALTVRAAS